MLLNFLLLFITRHILQTYFKVQMCCNILLYTSGVIYLQILVIFYASI